MNGNIMNKFVYVSKAFRKALQNFLNIDSKTGNRFWDNSWADEDFLEELRFKLKEEQYYLRKSTRPENTYLNDIQGETEFVFNMSMKHFGEPQEYEWTDGLPESLTDLIMDKAKSIADMGKKIQILYSGGVDSSLAVIALNEVCEKDQLEIIMGRYEGGGIADRNSNQASGTPIENNPWMFNNIIKHLDWKFTENLNGYCDPNQYVFVTGCEADRLFGSTGYTKMTQYSRPDGEDYKIYVGEPPTDENPEHWQWNQDRWWGITRYTYLIQSFRLLENISNDYIDLNNFQPMFFDRRMLQFAINLHIEKKHKWYNCGGLAKQEHFMNGKMWVRDAIFDLTKNKEQAYGMIKTASCEADINKKNVSPCWRNNEVLAITENGTVVNKRNIMDYLNRESLTI
jgi:hypothetical protein